VKTSTGSLESALTLARRQFVDQNPASAERHAAATRVLPGGNTRSVLFFEPFPLTLARGESCWLWDADGHRYLDLLGEYTAGIFGHNDPSIRAAVLAALDGGINLGGHHSLEAKLAALLCARFPSLERVRFTNSGTEANLMAIAAARAFTRRDRVLVFRGAYHGGVLSFSTEQAESAPNAPFQFVLADYNDIAGTQALVERDAERLAAILVEPMIGSGGCIPATPEFLAALRAMADRSGSLLIFDEVMTSRLSPGGLQEVSGILPDLTTLGKYIGGGMPAGAFGGRAQIMERFDPRRPDALRHAGTFNNNVVMLHAGVAALGEVYTPEAARRLNARGDALRRRLNDLGRRHGADVQFTGFGSMMHIHFTLEPVRSPADAARGKPGLTELFYLDMLRQGVWLARRGMISLSLPVGDAECEQFAGILEEFFRERCEWLGRPAT